MAKHLRIGDLVYVPWSRLGDFEDKPSAFHRTEVLDVVKRGVRVGLPGGNSTEVASSAVHTTLGVAVIRIGDLESERTLLDPLAKSVLQFCRLLDSDDSTTKLWEVRTIAELRHLWQLEGVGLRHVVLIGHGSANGVCFGTEGIKSPEDMGNVFALDNAPAKVFISLCCQTGVASFSKLFSKATICEALIAPYHGIHGAIASQFCQTFLAFHLLDGKTTSVAFKRCKDTVPGGKRLRLWQDGVLKP